MRAAAWTLGIIALLVAVGRCTPAHAHPDVILQCEKNIKISKAVPVGEPVIYENGMVGERYDRNGDGNVDIEALSIPLADQLQYNPVDSTVKYTHRRFPLFYAVDFDFDGQPDAVYIDRTEDGVNDPKQHCDNVILYEDLSKQRTTENPKADFEKKNQL